jgi:hypothetical protein
MDTSPCVSDYRNDDPQYWDPCYVKYPTCSLTGGDDDFEGPCLFHEHILTQDCGVQFEWMKAQLNAVPADDWLVIVGHHTLDDVNVEDFLSLLLGGNQSFSLYLNGHLHALSHYSLNGKAAFVTTGAGSMVTTADQSHHSLQAKKVMQQNEQLFVGNQKNHSYITLYNEIVAGFTSHYFRNNFSELVTEYKNIHGDVLYSFVVDREGNILLQ